MLYPTISNLHPIHPYSKIHFFLIARTQYSRKTTSSTQPSIFLSMCTWNDSSYFFRLLPFVRTTESIGHTWLFDSYSTGDRRGNAKAIKQEPSEIPPARSLIFRQCQVIISHFTPCVYTRRRCGERWPSVTRAADLWMILRMSAGSDCSPRPGRATW